MSETRFVRYLIALLRRNKKFCYKTSDRFQSGIPDIYVAGGTWIECKFKPYRIQSSMIRPLRGFSEAQIEFLNQLDRAGDKTYVAVNFVSQHKTSRVLLLNWPQYKAIERLSCKMIETMTVELKELQDFINWDGRLDEYMAGMVDWSLPHNEREVTREIYKAQVSE